MVVSSVRATCDATPRKTLHDARRVARVEATQDPLRSSVEGDSHQTHRRRFSAPQTLVLQNGAMTRVD